MEHISQLEAKEIRPGFFGKMIHGEKATVSIWDIRKGSRLETHQHEQEQITYITAGELLMNIGGQEYLLTEGCYHVIPSNVPHNAVALTDVKVMDFFAPARNDYR